MIDKDYDQKHKIVEQEAEYMNPGLIIYNRDSIPFERFLDYFDHTIRPVDHYFLGMAGWASLIAQTKFKFFPEEKYQIKYPPTEKTVMKHFTSPRRHEFYAYGIDMTRQRIK